MNEPVYLDHNATTPIRPEALEAVTRIAGMLGNPSSVHQYGRDVRRHIEDARDALASLVHAGPADVIFTSSGTEANNLALRGVGRDRVFVSAVEHVSVLEVRQGVSLIPVDENGVVNCKALEAMLAEDTAPALVSVMFANNETGVLQPIEDISAIAKQHDAWVHCDAVQGAGKAAINIDALGVDMLSLSSHKIGGPQGAGALIVQDTVVLVPSSTVAVRSVTIVVVRKMRRALRDLVWLRNARPIAKMKPRGLEFYNRTLRTVRGQFFLTLRFMARRLLA